jgi:hypothetical protein
VPVVVWASTGQASRAVAAIIVPYEAYRAMIDCLLAAFVTNGVTTYGVALGSHTKERVAERGWQRTSM